MRALGPFLDRAVSETAGRVKHVKLEWAVQQRNLPDGTYVFSGLCSASDAARDAARLIAEQLAAGSSSIRMLNHPERVAWRYELSRLLYAEGINQYRSYRVSDLTLETPRFPVFVRGERMHTGNLTPLLENPEGLRVALARLHRRGLHPKELLVVEYQHAPGPDGVFRKYTYCRVGDALIPRYITWNRHWLVKGTRRDVDPDDPDAERLVSEELEWAQRDPWRDLLWKVFQLANIEYGRADCGVVNGVPQIWEINTAPYIDPRDLNRPEADWLSRLRAPTKDLFYARFFPALAALDTDCADEEVPISIDDALIEQLLKQESSTRRFLLLLRPLKFVAKRWPRKMPFKLVRMLFRPLSEWIAYRYHRRVY